MKTGRVVGLRWLPQELLLEVLAFAPMRSYGRLAACSGFLERLVREHADWTACYATLRGGAPDDDDACGEDGVVERAAAPGTARSNPGGVRTPPARSLAGARSRPSPSWTSCTTRGGACASCRRRCPAPAAGASR